MCIRDSIDNRRMLQFESSWGGQKIISNGRLVQDGREIHWYTKCDTALPVAAAQNDAARPAAATLSGVKTIFEKYKLIGTFAADCSKPASPNNLHYIHR